MVNGSSYKTGLNVHLLVEEENNSFKESANLLLDQVNHVKKDLKFYQENVMNNPALHLTAINKAKN